MAGQGRTEQVDGITIFVFQNRTSFSFVLVLCGYLEPGNSFFFWFSMEHLDVPPNVEKCFGVIRFCFRMSSIMKCASVLRIDNKTRKEKQKKREKSNIELHFKCGSEQLAERTWNRTAHWFTIYKSNIEVPFCWTSLAFFLCVCYRCFYYCMLLSCCLTQYSSFNWLLNGDRQQKPLFKI